jgi:sugar phosphate isomerase/epimerase
VISTLAQALDIAERFDTADVGVVVDTFHLWWEPDIADQLLRAGPRIVSYQVCDWITPLPADTLLARGMMGDGHIDFAAFTRFVARAGYRGDIEVEIFNADLWAAPPTEVVDTMVERYLKLVQPNMGKEAP